MNQKVWWYFEELETTVVGSPTNPILEEKEDSVASPSEYDNPATEIESRQNTGPAKSITSAASLVLNSRVPAKFPAFHPTCAVSHLLPTHDGLLNVLEPLALSNPIDESIKWPSDVPKN